MRGVAIGFSLVLLLTVSACAQSVAIAPAETRDDPFLPYTETSAGQSRAVIPNGLAQIELLKRKDRKTGVANTLLHVATVYHGSHREKYESARNAKAEPLKFQPYNYEKSCEKRDCQHTEVFFVEIPEQELKQAGPDGYALKIFARGGTNLTITIPPGLIARL